MDLTTLTETTFWGNTLLRWGLALLAALAAFILMRLARRLVVASVKRLVAKTHFAWDDLVVDLLANTRSFFFFGLSLYAGMYVLDLRDDITVILNRGIVALILFQVAIWGSHAIRFGVETYTAREDLRPATRTTLSAINFISRLVLYSIIVLLLLDNFGFNITTLVAGLGITSIAVALAVQNLLGDLFSSLSIVLDKPFEIGDFITVGEFSGTIEKIGLRSTHIRSLSGEQLIFPNKGLLESRIRNYKRMNERRILFTIGVIYQTPAEKLRRIPDILKEAVEAQDKVRFDRAHFKTFGPFSLDFEVVYFVLESDYYLYMDTQQTINLTIYERFEAEGIGFAYPTQTLFLNAESGFEMDAQPGAIQVETAPNA